MIKEELKKIKFLRKLVKSSKIKREYRKDAKYFCNYYIESESSYKDIEYNVMLLVHSLEKGMSFKTLRPFGESKIQELINELKRLERYEEAKNNTPYKMGTSVVNEWIKIYDENQWDSQVLVEAKNYIDNVKIDNHIVVGSIEYGTEDYKKYFGFDYLDAIKTRHSVRDFKSKSITKEDLNYCIEAAKISPSACNRQMCKLYYINNKEKKELLEKYIMGLSGFNKETVNLFVFTYDVSSLSFYGERNQGYLNAGLFAMNFVNALHFRGIGSCFLQWANTYVEEEMIRKILDIPANEKIAIVLGAGYYVDNTKIPASQRKSTEEIYKEIK